MSMPKGMSEIRVHPNPKGAAVLLRWLLFNAHSAGVVLVRD
jgi:hypothetical protein